MHGILFAVIVAFGVAVSACGRDAIVRDAGRPNAATLLPADLGVGTGVAMVLRGRSRRVDVYSRGDDADRPSRAEDLVDVVSLLAGLRTGVIDEHTVHRCNGLNCSRAHGDVTAAQALSLSCLHFFDDLGSRIGADALAPAFLALGLTPPAIPADRDARVRLASRGEGWSVSPRQLLPLARALRDHAAPWSPVFDQALIPAVGEPASLRGKAAGTGEISGWFVGYASTGEASLVVVRVSRCVEMCAARAISVARWAVAHRSVR